MNPRHLSLSAERYTPGYIIDPGRCALGGWFDLDPASCEKANSIVKAHKILTVEDDGLEHGWAGRLLVNPPGTCKAQAFGEDVFPGCGTFLEGSGARETWKRRKTCSCRYVSRFWQKLINHVDEGVVPGAIWIGFNCSQLQTLQLTEVSPLRFLTCFINHRVRYLDANLKPMNSPPHNSYVTLVAPPGSEYEASFIENYRELGDVTRSAL